MAARASYELKIAGELENVDGSGARDHVVDGVRRRFVEVFPESQPNAVADGTWPNGFVLGGYRACLWLPRVERYNATGIIMTFSAELNIIVDGGIYDVRDRLLEDVRWFYHYKEKPWYQRLHDLLDELNRDLAKQFGPEKLVSRVMFCGWKWYCGNGGGS